MRYALISFALAAIALPALASPSKPSPRQVPAAIMASTLKDIRDDGNRRRLAPDRMFRRLDINGDGIFDWVVDFNHAGTMGWCGTGGCRELIYVSEPHGRYRVVFDQQVREFSLMKRAEGVRLNVDVHGSFCGTFGASACPYSFTWDRGSNRFIEAPTPEGITRVRAILLSNVEAAKPPPQAVQAIKAQAAQCVKAGGTPDNDAESVMSVPDLNGDGVRDWVAAALWCTTPTEVTGPDLHSQVYLSGAAGYRLAKVLEGSGFEIEIASQPARLVELTTEQECGYATLCGERVWAWDPGKAEFHKISEAAARPRPDSE